MKPGEAPAITIPITAGPFAKNTTVRALLWVSALGRLKEGVTPQQARGQLHSFWHEALVQTAPTSVPGLRLQSWLNMGLEVKPAATGVNRFLRAQFVRPLRVLMGVSVLILLVACVNLAGLTLARAAARSREMSVRLSLGATRWQIIRQLLVDSILLSSAGTLVALGLADWAGHLLVAALGDGGNGAVILDLRPDWHVFGYGTLVAVGCGVLIGLAPAWQTSRQQPSAALQSDERTLTRGTGRVGKGLMIVQIALSFVLLLGAVLLLRTFVNLRALDPEFQRSGVIQVTLQKRPDAPKNLDMNSYRRELLDGVTSLPGVVSASFAALEIPAADYRWKDQVSTSTDSSADAGKLATLVDVSPGFFRTLGIPMVSGREFDWNDDEQHPRVAIVDANLAGKLAPSGEILGARVRFGAQPDFQQLQVVGVARSARLIKLRDAKAMVIYIPSTQQPQGDVNMFVRAQNPAAIAETVERETASHGYEYAVSAQTLEDNAE